MRVPVKNMPKLKLVDLLRRRKMSLRQLIDEFGITTFEGLVIRCDRMGVLPPEESEFKVAYPLAPVNSPTEGVVVLEPPPVVDDITGRKIDPEAPVAPEVKVVTDVKPLGQLLPRTPSEYAQLAHEAGHDSLGLVSDPELSVVPTEPSQKKLRKKKEATQGE